MGYTLDVIDVIITRQDVTVLNLHLIHLGFSQITFWSLWGYAVLTGTIIQRHGASNIAHGVNSTSKLSQLTFTSLSNGLSVPLPDVSSLFSLYDAAMRNLITRQFELSIHPDVTLLHGLTKIPMLQKPSDVYLKDTTGIARHLRHLRLGAYTQG